MISKATMQEAEQVFELQVLLCKEDCPDYELPDLQRMKDGIFKSVEHGDYFVAKEQDKVVGCLRFQTMFSDWNATYRIFIDGIYVVQEFRRKGLCKAMFNELFNAYKNEVCDFQLGVHRHNHNAIQLYRKLGFTSEDYDLMTKWNDARLKS